VSNIQNKDARGYLAFITFLFAAFLGFFRYSTGSDYFSYFNILDNIGVQYTRISQLEVGFYYLVSFLKIIFNDTNIVMGIITITPLFLVFQLSKKRNIPLWILLVIYLFMFYQASFNLMRMSIAIMIMIVNYDNIYKGKIIPFILGVIIASTFHISAIFCLPLYLLHKENNLFGLRFIFLTILYICFIIYLHEIFTFLLDLIRLDDLHYYLTYLGNSNIDISIAVKRGLVYVPIVLFSYYAIVKYKIRKINLYFQIYFIGVVLYFITTFNSTYVDRLSYYFLFSALILVAISLSYFLKNKRYLIFLSETCYILFFWFYVFYLKGDHSTFPYDWIFYRLC
jgi:hypothetical protein